MAVVHDYDRARAEHYAGLVQEAGLDGGVEHGHREDAAGWAADANNADGRVFGWAAADVVDDFWRKRRSNRDFYEARIVGPRH